MSDAAVGWSQQPDTNEYALDLAWGQKAAYAPFTANVRHDGCVHLWRHHSYPTPEMASAPDYDPDEDTDYMHICELDEMIGMLTALKEKAKAYFGEEWS